MADAGMKEPRPFEIFRASEAVDYREDGVMHSAPATEEQQAGMAALHAAGMAEGSKVKLLYSRPGMSLTYVWFKSGFPLPLHSHSADCLYFIVAGSLKIGIEQLGPGDGFFLGTDVPYTYVPGESGVEVLEFRTSDCFDFKALAANPAYWQKAVANLIAAKGNWAGECPPSGMEVG